MAQIKAILAEQSKSDGAAKPYQTRIALSSSWQGNDPYTQEVTVEDATENSRVDLHPNATTLVQLAEDGVSALYVENNDGTFTANSIGGPPSTSMLMLATVTEVTPAPAPAPTLTSISITTPPTKTSYQAFETFDATGMAVTATYSDGSTRAVTSSCTWPTTQLSAGTTSITISYTESDITRTVTQNITVSQVPNTMTLSETSITLDSTTKSTTFTISGNYDGTLSVSSDNTSVVTVSRSGSTVTVNSVNDTDGTATITVTASGGNYTAASKTCSVTASFFVNPISGTVSPGSTVTFAGKSWIVQHVDGNYAYLASNGIVSTGAFASSNSNVYANSDILKTTCANYETTLGSEAMSYCQSVTVNGGTSKVFIPSKAQYESDWDWPKASADNRKQTGGNSWYWTSSPNPGYSNYVWFVSDDGNFINYNVSVNNARGGFRPAVVVKFRTKIEDGEYGSSKIAGTLEKGSTVKFDGIDWIIVDISGSTYTLMKYRMDETTQFGSSTTYSGSTIASKCTTFQNTMSANALSVVNSKTVQSVTAKVWIAQKTDIANWTEYANPTSYDWSGIRKWTNNDGVYDGVGTNYYWSSDPYDSGNVWRINHSGYFSNGGIGPSYTGGFRPCIEVTQ